MSKQNFDAFINQINIKQDEKKIDWNKIRDEWLQHLEQFYETIKKFLDEYKESGKLSYQFSPKDIFEDHIGSYSVRVMDIRLGEHRVKLEPIGTSIISADGRVDLIGANGTVKFVLVNKNYSAPSPIKATIKTEYEIESVAPEIEKIEPIELAWKIATPPPKIQYRDLNQEVFLEALLEVVGG